MCDTGCKRDPADKKRRCRIVQAPKHVGKERQNAGEEGAVQTRKRSHGEPARKVAGERSCERGKLWEREIAGKRWRVAGRGDSGERAVQVWSETEAGHRGKGIFFHWNRYSGKATVLNRYSSMINPQVFYHI